MFVILMIVSLLVWYKVARDKALASSTYTATGSITECIEISNWALRKMLLWMEKRLETSSLILCRLRINYATAEEQTVSLHMRTLCPPSLVTAKLPKEITVRYDPSNVNHISIVDGI